jgi:putative membrane protein
MVLSGFSAEGAFTMVTLFEKYACHSSRRSGRALRALAASVLMLAAAVATAQDGAGAPAQVPGASVAAASPLTQEERSLMGYLAQVHMAEIEAGQLALEKSASEQVKAFAQRVVDEHSADLQALRTLAQARGVTLPDETTIRSKSQGVVLKTLSGSPFDRQYLKRMGISEHQRTIGLLHDGLKNILDPELRALAGKMLPSAQSHLQKARYISVQPD